jgi:putative AbiEi antitoxin of type IV toxin-antitoxin system
MVQPRQEASRRLFDLAEQQQGYFTTKQAKAAGFAENTHPYHVQAGNWVREHRGIYRLARFPATDRPDLALGRFGQRTGKKTSKAFIAIKRQSASMNYLTSIRRDSI